MSTDPASEAIRLLTRACDAIPEETARADPRLAAIRHACIMGLDASRESEAPERALATFGAPEDRRQRWIIRFEDADVADVVYDARVHGEAGAELLARAAFREAEGMWNCHLMRIASIDAADEERQRARADRLEREIADLRAGKAEEAGASSTGAETILDQTGGAVPSIAARIARTHEKHLAGLGTELKRHRRSLEIEERYDKANPEYRAGLSEEELRDIATSEAYAVRKSASLMRDLALAERVHEAWRGDPASLLLPIGTVVRTREVEMLPDDWQIPIAGSIGVVIGYSDMRSRPNVVGFMGTVQMTAYDAQRGDEDGAVRFNYLPEELEALEYGVIADAGAPVNQAGWWPTHGHGRKGDILYTESMVVRSNGFLWRIQPCPDLPECTQITTDDAAGRRRFSHLRLLEDAS